jgi:RNA polymerase sigma-70 factor (ECF subfamily)
MSLLPALAQPIANSAAKLLQDCFLAVILNVENVSPTVRNEKVEWITTTQVLEDLKAPDNDELAWQRFCEHFNPVVVNFARRLGLSTTDAEDAAQEAMLAFLKAFRSGKYQREKGRLSNWLFGVARRVILNFRRAQPLERLIADKTTATSFWDMIQDDGNIKHSWEMEWKRMVLTKCLEQARRELDPKVFKAFELYALSDTPVDKVAQRFSMSRNAVYIAKSRVLSRLRQLKQQFE